MSLIVNATVDYDPSRPSHLVRARYYKHEARPDRIPAGASWPSVTTICDLLGKVWMAPWAAKKMYEEIEAKAKENTAGIWTTAEAVDVAREAKTAWRRTRDTAAQTGTDLHEVFEDIIMGGSNWNVLKDGDAKDEAAYRWAAKVRGWLASNVIGGDSAEKCIAHPYGGGFAGRYDAVVYQGKRKRLGLLDLKTGKNVPSHAPLQMAAYANALKLDGVRVGWAVVLHAPAGNDKVETTFFTSSELDAHWKAFKALRHVWSWYEKYGGE